ncbi:MAG TPA: ABC transporter ATP-binding protein [Actinomycetota bacterium]
MIRLITTYLRPYRRQLVLVVSLLLVQAISNLYLPTLNADIINNGVVKGDTHHIVMIGGLMLAVTLLMGVAAVIAVYWSARTAMGFGRDVRSALFRKVQGFSQMEVSRFGTPSLITRTTNDMQQVQMLVLMSLTVMILAPIMCIGGVFMALRMNARLSLLLVVIIPVMALFIGVMVSKAIPLFRQMQAKIDGINRVLRETLSGIRVIRAFDRTEHEERRFDESNVDLTGVTLRVTRLFALMMPTIMLITNLSTVAVMWFGSIQVGHGRMEIGNLTAFLTYVIQILFSVLMATMMFLMIPRAAASAERIQEVLDTEPTVLDPEMPATAPRLGTLEFRDVEFRYPGAEDPVLSGISFSAGPGEVTAIVGSTGSGKSTLVNLVTRFQDVTGGAVLVDGTDIREMAQQDLWGRIGLVPQRAFLFSGTVGSNIRDGDEHASDEEVWHALRVAQAADFVAEMPEGLEAPITQGGTNVSGGQRQRLAIARAVLKRPEIYVFDDAFSALDFTTDALLRAALRAETADATVLIVAQRVGTIMHADRILVLADGSIVGAGTHEQLLETCDTYQEIVYSQLSPEEAA